VSAQSVSYWDAFGLGLGSNSTRIFGNANVGNLALTNLQVSGQFGHSDEVVFLQRWYARHNLREGAPLFEALAETIIITFVVGNRVTWSQPLADLLRRRPREDQPFHARDPWYVELPERQHIYVNVDRFTMNDSVDAWNELMEMHGLAINQRFDAWPPQGQPLIWIQFDGITTSGDDTAQVRRELARRLRQYQSAEENIADYILALASTARDESTLGTLNAVRDGVLDGRHRGLAPQPPLLEPADKPLPIDE